MVNDVRNNFNGQCFEMFGGFGYMNGVWVIYYETWAVLKRFYCYPNAVGYAGLV